MGWGRDMQAPHYPRDDKVPWLNQGCCDQRERRRKDEDEQEGCFGAIILCGLPRCERFRLWRHRSCPY